MLELLQAAFYMGGSFVFIGLLFLPAVLLVVALLVQICVTFFPIKCAGYVSAVLYSAVFAVTATKIPEMMAEMVNQTNYVMGSVGGCLFYIIAAFVLVAAAIVACFFAQTAHAVS